MFCSITRLSLALSFLALAASAAEKTPAASVDDFLNSIGATSSVTRRGETREGTIKALKYTGLRWLRSGFEEGVPIEDFVAIHRATGARFSYGMLSGHSDVDRLLRDAKRLANAGALIALEGSNEPNNFGPIRYKGEVGGLMESWLPVAKMHRDLYARAKADPTLKKYPVWSLCEPGAQPDNCGLQFLTIPEGAGTLMPDGTKFADAATCHNYICHPSWPGIHDNQTWISSRPGRDCKVNGLYTNFGYTWRNGFRGYSEEELKTLPRVTTETGITVGTGESDVTEEMQARMYLNLYLSQFAQGWSHTAMYLFKGRVDEPDHEAFAFYKLDYTPKQAAHYMHNFTTILNDKKPVAASAFKKLDYEIPDQPWTTHDLLLQRSNGAFCLVLWGERFKSGGSDDITVKLGRPYKRVFVYDPVLGKGIQQTLSETDTIPVSLTDHPVILEITDFLVPANSPPRR